jgi:hypothetical protein
MHSYPSAGLNRLFCYSSSPSLDEIHRDRTNRPVANFMGKFVRRDTPTFAEGALLLPPTS